MIVNYTLVLIATVAQFILGAVWYSPLMFGKWWAQIMGMDKLSVDELKKLQKDMTPFYGLQLVLTLVTTSVLAMFVYYLQLANVGFHSFGVAGWLWLGFVAPIQIASVIWGNTQRKFWTKQIFVMLSMQLAGLMLAAWILSM